MFYRVLADAVMFVHLAFILFVAAGALLTWAWPRMAWAHLPALAWGVGTVTIGFPCPLTSVEKALERRASGDSYDGGFVDHYLEDVVFPGEYSSALRALAAVVIVFSYSELLRRRNRVSPHSEVSPSERSSGSPATAGTTSGRGVDRAQPEQSWPAAG